MSYEICKNKISEYHDKHCEHCKKTTSFGYWEDARPADPLQVGLIYSQCIECGNFGTGWDSKPKVPSYAISKVTTLQADECTSSQKV